MIQLIVGIGRATNVDRSWRIKIALLPCLAEYLGAHLFLNKYYYYDIALLRVVFLNTAPPDCLQYHTQTTGMIKSFNWKDVAPAAASPRQLAEQDYQICFRQEVLNNNQVSRLVGVR